MTFNCHKHSPRNKDFSINLADPLMEYEEKVSTCTNFPKPWSRGDP